VNISGEQVKHIVETLAYGAPTDIVQIIYGNDSLTDIQLKVPLDLLTQLHAPSNDMAISVPEAGFQDPFWMLILNVPWLDSERSGSFHPLLLAHQDSEPKVAGFVLPWNEIRSMLNDDQMVGSQNLVTWWATWLQNNQNTN